MQGEVAVIRQGSRWTAVLQVTAPAYPLADRATQQERVSAWGSLLAQLGQEGSRLAAIQWLERTIPDSGRGLEDWWRAKGVPVVRRAREHYERLIAAAGPAATRHETFVAVSIDERRCRRAVRAAGGGPDGISQVLVNELSWVEAGLRRCDVQVVGWLGPDGPRAAGPHPVRPAVHAAHRQPRQAGLGRGVRLSAAGPMAARSAFSHYRTDSGLHAVYWIASWPRMQVQAAWLYPLLVLGGVRRTVSVTAEPIPPSQSFREVRSAKVQKLTDEAQRETVRSDRDRAGRRGARRGPAPRARAGARPRRVPVHRLRHRLRGQPSPSSRRPVRQIEQAAVRSVLEVRRVFGEQDQAFVAAALPLTRGVR